MELNGFRKPDSNLSYEMHNGHMIVLKNGKKVIKIAEKEVSSFLTSFQGVKISDLIDRITPREEWEDEDPPDKLKIFNILLLSNYLSNISYETKEDGDSWVPNEYYFSQMLSGFKTSLTEDNLLNLFAFTNYLMCLDPSKSDRMKYILDDLGYDEDMSKILEDAQTKRVFRTNVQREQENKEFNSGLGLFLSPSLDKDKLTNEF